MGWLTDVGNVAVGMIERDREITKEDLVVRADNLKANQEILIKQKEYKWAKELEDYEKEKVKFDQLEAANAIFKIDNNDINYAMSVLPITTPNWDKLTTEMKNEQIFNFKGETFDYTLEGNRDQINRKAALELTTLNDIVSKEIKEAKGNSFLINKILRKKESAEKNIMESIERELEAAKTIQLTEKKLNPENVGLAVEVGTGTSDDRAWTKFQKSELGKLWVAKFLKEQDESRFKKITAKDNFNDILKFMDVKELGSEANFRTDGYDVKIEGVNDATRAMFDTYKGVYFAVWSSIDMKELWVRGVTIDALSKEVNANVIQKQIYQVVESRIFIDKMTKAWGAEKDFMGVLPLNLIPLNLENVNYGKIDNVDIVDEDTGHKLDTLTLTAPNKVFTILYERFIKDKASEMSGGESLSNLNKIQTLMTKGASQKLIEEFKIYVGQNFEKIAEELEITDITQTQKKKFSLVDNNGQISLFDSTSGKAVSLSQLKEDGNLEAVLVKYPWIKDDPQYIAWLKTQEQ